MGYISNEKALLELKKELAEIKEILKDLIFISAVGATENIQTTENTSSLLRGEVPEGCKMSHLKIRERILEATDRWSGRESKDLKEHLFGHKHK